MPRAGAGLDHPELELPEVRNLWETEGLFPITISKRDFDRTPGGALVFFGQWSVSGLSAEALAEIEMAANYFELVGQFEALISSD